MYIMKVLLDIGYYIFFIIELKYLILEFLCDLKKIIFWVVYYCNKISS